jgi:hypothetical protein
MKAYQLLLVLATTGTALARPIPDVTCKVEDYPVKAVVAWQFPQLVGSVQVAVLRDPSGEQEARFDLTHGGTLISLRYQGKEMLFGQTAGASVSLFSTRQGSEEELKGLNPYWSAFSPDQGGSSMGIPAITTGIACDGPSTFRAFAMMQDRGVDNSFQPDPLLGVEAGKISGNFPPGYSTAYSIETTASWTANPGGAPKYFLKLEQNVVNTRADKSGPLEWYLTAAAPWDFEHSSSYPEKCAPKTPCTSAAANAVGEGRYADAQLENGTAIVVPTADWQSDRVYTRDNAEYVVLLYNAVWAAPRRTFAVVMQHALDGVASRRFSWYICVGSWRAAQQFAESQPAPTKTVLPPPAPLPATKPSLKSVTVACQTTEFKPQPNQVDRAIILEDPAHEQTLVFDTTQGGAIVSWKYRDVEHVWGSNGGGLLQMAFHNHMVAGAWDGDYNPTQAGDGTANSPVTGIACNGTQSVDILTTMLDFNHNNGFYAKPLIAVWDGKVNDMVPLSYSSPYTLETRAEWVENPDGAPRYYLKLQEHFVHVADEKIGEFGYDFASYEPWEFVTRAISPEKCPCASTQTTYMAGGWYENEQRQEGLAVAMPASNFPGAKVSGGFNSDYMWRNRSFHLSSTGSLDGIAAKDFVWYAMPGPWNSALKFAQALKWLLNAALRGLLTAAPLP